MERDELLAQARGQTESGSEGRRGRWHWAATLRQRGEASRGQAQNQTEARASTGECIYGREVRARADDTSRRSEAAGKAVAWSTRRRLWSGGCWEKEPWRAAAMA